VVDKEDVDILEALLPIDDEIMKSVRLARMRYEGKSYRVINVVFRL